MLLRPMGRDAGGLERPAFPGDILAGGESLTAGAIATVGNGTWTGAAIASGIIKRSGSVAGYTDTTDTAANIIAAIAGNAGQDGSVPGTSFRLLVINTVAFADTFAAGAGVVAGGGTLNIAASTWREYLVTILNDMNTTVIMGSTTNASAAVTFANPIPLTGSNGSSNNSSISNLVGATVSGTGITAGTTVIGQTQGPGGITGVTLSANATATNNNIALTFGPTVQFDGLRSGTL